MATLPESATEAIEKFLAANANFESSMILEMVMAEIREAPDLDAAALIPLRHRLLGFTSALAWSFFLHEGVAAPLAAQGGAAAAGAAEFDVSSYYSQIANIFDLAVEDAVGAFVDEEDEEAEDEEEVEEEEEEG